MNINKSNKNRRKANNFINFNSQIIKSQLINLCLIKQIYLHHVSQFFYQLNQINKIKKD